LGLKSGMIVQLSGKKYVSILVGLGFDPMLSHPFLINYLRVIGVEVAGQCGAGAGVVGPSVRGVGWRAHVAEGGRQGWGQPPC
jgi:hypothetical protein